MAGKTVKLYDLSCRDDLRNFSPFCWRIRLACYYKGLKVDVVPWRFTEKDRIKFANSDKVPVLVDGEKTLHESFEIAKYLEKTYPDPPLFGSKQGEAGALFVDSFANTVLGDIFSLLLVDILEKLDKRDQEYFRTDREKMFGGKLEEVSKGEKEKVKTFREHLEPVRQVLNQQKFIGGDQPSYADFTLLSIFLTPKAVSKIKVLDDDDIVTAWAKRVLDLFKDQLPKDQVWESTSPY